VTPEWNDIQRRLPIWLEESRKRTGEGAVATYIPELAEAPRDAVGFTIMDRHGGCASAGDSGIVFTLQSISKVFTLLLALMDRGEKEVFSKVGMEPTGDNFNSILKLELVQPGIPFNPMINAGAIAISSLINGATSDEKVNRILEFFREIAGSANMTYNEAVYKSETATAHRNRSLAYFLKANGVLTDEVEPILEVYFKHCAIEADCSSLARMALVLAGDGHDPVSGKSLIPRRYVQIAKSFMVTCGMYNESGEFAIRAGLPAKSGVSGAILAIVPGRYGIGVVGPALNAKGNSTAGVHLLEAMSKDMDWSIF
jgi:glutaminase